MNTDNQASTRAFPPRRLWWLAGGFGVWCSALIVLYALHGIGCAYGWPTSTLRITLVVVFFTHLVVVAWMCHNFAKATPDPSFDPTGQFLHTAIVWTAIAAAVATLLTFGPPMFLDTCI